MGALARQFRLKRTHKPAQTPFYQFLDAQSVKLRQNPIGTSEFIIRAIRRRVSTQSGSFVKHAVRRAEKFGRRADAARVCGLDRPNLCVSPSPVTTRVKKLDQRADSDKFVVMGQATLGMSVCTITSIHHHADTFEPV
jgi:hypothetical protein